jgi:hypothetical protein
MRTLLEIFVLPPMAVARLGGSDSPLESYRWTEDTSDHGSSKTILEPAVTLNVNDDGSVEAMLPASIHFKDAHGSVRPVAPFFELWALLQDSATGEQEEVAVTLALLRELGASEHDIRYTVTAANRKAARRTDDAACGFIARVEIAAGDYTSHELLAISPHTSGQEPLVYPDKPIPLGRIQVLRPVEGTCQVSPTEPLVDYSVLRLRYTPPKGIVYGPPNATFAPASPVEPGIYDAAVSEYGRIHEIVAPENRYLNPNTPWSTYIMMTGLYEDQTPQDGYDGANVGNSQAWGVVDDTNDAIIEVELALGGRRFSAMARVFTGPPDFAPDRRPICSIADDLADRDLPVPEVSARTMTETKDEVLDLFRRAFETSSLLNLDASRARALDENAVRQRLAKVTGPMSPPKTGPESMTELDKPYADKMPALNIPQEPSIYAPSVAHDTLPFSQVVPFVHEQMNEETVLMDFLRRRSDRVRTMVRPPFGLWSQLAPEPGPDANPAFRDPRVLRDCMHDMRMPPYMRDANLYPLSLTHRQYDTLMKFLDMLDAESEQGEVKS